MANQQHIDLFKHTVVTMWNQWRKEHQDIQPDLSGANLFRAYLRGVDLIRADLSETDLRRADLREANLFSANLREANLSGADLSGANLDSTTLDGTILDQATLHRANLSGASLNGANLHRADLSEATLYHARLAWTFFGYVDLSRVKGLETVQHGGPSALGIETIYRSQGNIPDIFLRGAGIPDSFINYIHSLVGTPLDYSSCFISYSSQDQAFAERLYADLQSTGVRCWFAPEDIKIGDKIRHRIDESIRLYDKLLLVLSEHSVRSQWVEKEVETAFEKERQHKQEVLFPIRIDESVMQTTEAWAADIRRTRHIGDFTRWKQHDDYQQALERLLRDLKAEG